MMKTGIIAIILVVMGLSFLSGCGEKKADTKNGDASGTAAANFSKPGEEGAREVLNAFVKGGADYAALSDSIRPNKADFEAVFSKEVAEKLIPYFDKRWPKGAPVIKPNEGQTELILYSGTTEELKSGQGGGRKFPGGYCSFAKDGHLKDGITLYGFNFVKPGEKRGMSFAGLTFVNGRWVIFPKPWRAIR